MSHKPPSKRQNEAHETEIVQTIELPESEAKQLITHAFRYSAPIPPASEAEKYEAVQKGSFDRILKMAETRLHVDAEICKKEQKYEFISSLVGQLVGSFCLLSLIGAATYITATAVDPMAYRVAGGMIAPAVLAVLGRIIYVSFKASRKG